MSDGASTSSTHSFACPRCPKSYKRREHLQRHALTHVALLPHRCALCGNAYGRADVLKRHVQTCGARVLGGATPSKRRACDRCVQMKKACNTKRPCNTCRARGVKCQYSFLPGASATAGVDADDADDAGDVDDGNNADDVDRAAMTSGSVDTSTSAPATAADVETARPSAPPPTLSGIMSSSAVNMPSDMASALAFGTPSPSRYFGGGVNASLLPFSPILGGLASPSHVATSASWLDFLNLAADCMPLFSDHSQSPRPTSYSFHFLDNFTKKTGLVNSFECGTPLQREHVMAAIAQRVDAATAAPPLLTTTLPADVSSAGPAIAAAANSVSAHPQSFTVLQDPLIVKTHQIVFRIREVVTVKPRNSAVALDWSVAIEQQCLQFFSPSSLVKFLDLYWALWHPNVNLVHRPSFDPVDSKCVLVAAMALLGACMSSDVEDNTLARMWFNCVEEIVFIDDDFACNPQTEFDRDPYLSTLSAHTLSPTTALFDPASNKRKIQALQASYVVCLYQNWEGSDESKQRIRRYRFSTVVAVARDIGIHSAHHIDYSSASQHEFNWKGFVAREQLIRTFLWIYLLDQAFVIFNNLPPRMMIKEMRMHLAWPEATFQADSAAECARAAQSWLQQSAPLHGVTLREATEIFCTSAMAPEVCRYFANLGPLNLFAIVSALHFLIFQKQNSFGGEDQLQAIRTGLENWKHAWEIYSSEFAAHPPHAMVPVKDGAVEPDDMWRRNGFMRHSPEYWLLAHLVINRLSMSGAAERPARRLGLGRLHSMGIDTVEGRGVDDTTRDPLLTKYDETSMRQVNDLISQFQGIQL